MRVVKILFTTAIALAVMAVCGFLCFTFWTVSFLPRWLSILMMALCVIAFLATIRLWTIAIRPDKREKQDKYIYHPEK